MSPHLVFPPVRFDAQGLTKCRVCGCTAARGCEPPCSWVGAEDLCSGCERAASLIAAAMDYWFDCALKPQLAPLMAEVKRRRLASKLGRNWRRNAIKVVTKGRPA